MHLRCVGSDRRAPTMQCTTYFLSLVGLIRGKISAWSYPIVLLSDEELTPRLKAECAPSLTNLPDLSLVIDDGVGLPEVNTVVHRNTSKYLSRWVCRHCIAVARAQLIAEPSRGNMGERVSAHPI